MARRRSFTRRIIWVVRACFLLVFAWNVLCALQFVVIPEQFMGAFQLSGIPGEVAVRGMGIAFLMWNATYPLFIYNPRRFFILGIVIVAQQLIGCVGEGFILHSLQDAPAPFIALAIQRFLAFDVVGLAIMAASVSALFYSLKQ